MLRFTDFRIDASTIQTLPDGSIKLVGQLTRPGIFSYRNPDGSERREWRPPEEVLKPASLQTFSMTPITVNHPRQPSGGRLVTPSSWKRDAVGHLGENVREDSGLPTADFYIRDASAISDLRSGKIGPFVSCGYSVDFDATPGVTPDGQRYDGVQRNIRGNHVAILPKGTAPRGGDVCVLRLDSAGDEVSPLNSNVDLEALQAQVTVLTAELAKARVDAAELPKLNAALEKANADLAAAVAQVSPERLDSLVEERMAVVAKAKAEGVETAGKSNLQIKRAIVAKRTPDLSARVDSLGAEAVDAILAVYAAAPHPTLAAVLPTAPAAGSAPETRTDAVPKMADLYSKFLQDSQNAWKNNGDFGPPQVSK